MFAIYNSSVLPRRIFIPQSIWLYIMDFLSEKEIYLSIFFYLFPYHKVIRTAVFPIYSVLDIPYAIIFPRIKYHIHYTLHYQIAHYFHEKSKITGLTTFYHISPDLYHITYLNISHSRILSLPPELTELKHLDISKTLITTIPDTYTKLEYLDAYHSQISELSPLFTELEYLNISQTMVDDIPETYTKLHTLLGEQLEELYCRDTFLFNIPTTFTRLKKLESFQSYVDPVLYT